jgi:subtilase family serine protease
MTRGFAPALAIAAMLALLGAPSALARKSQTQGAVVPQAVQAPDSSGTAADTTTPACTPPTPDVNGVVHTYTWYHCSTPQDIRSWYGIDRLGNYGTGQTIVLVDSYGSPTAAQDLQKFHDTFFGPDSATPMPNPNFDEVYPNGSPDYKNVGNGQSGSAGAANWAGEANLDVEWAYAMAPLAHIVLLAVPPAETEGVQGFPNLFKAIKWAIDKYPSGTVFSQSFGVTEETFGGNPQNAVAKFDAVYKAAKDKGDTVLASSGDDGTSGVSKQHRDANYYDHATDGWPASSPWVTAVGGTQLQKGWHWNPQSDMSFTAARDYNPPYWQYTDGPSSEAVWNESWLPAATGGGPSSIYARPQWQDSQANVIGGNHRGVPDLAWNAAVNGGVLVWTTFFPQVSRAGWHVYGGTSAAAPQVAGLIALANEQQANDNEPSIGYLNPLLYQVGANDPSAFSDIVPQTYGSVTSGDLKNNQMFAYNGDGLDSTVGPISGWPTQSGWDMTTGFGTPRAAQFVSALRAARNAP